MTVSTLVNKRIATGDNSTTAFAFTFQFFLNSEIEVLLDGVVQTETTDYTLINDDPGGTVTFLTAPGTDVQVLMRRTLPLSQLFDYVENDDFPAETHEEALDRVVMIAQQQQEVLDRTLRLQETSEATEPQVVDITGGAGKTLIVNPAEDGFDLADVSAGGPLTSPLPIAEGGTQAATAAGARTNLGLTEALVTAAIPLSLANGGTGETDASGLGTQNVPLPPSNDLDNVVRTGWTRTDASTDNSPFATAIFAVETIRVSATQLVQFAYRPDNDLDTTKGGPWWRAFESPTWIGWKRLPFDLASQAQAEGGTVANVYMDPLRTAQAIAALNTATFNNSFVSTDQTITNAGQLVLAHSLGTIPQLIQLQLIAQNTVLGYTAGDIVIINPGFGEGSSNKGISVLINSTDVVIRFSSVSPNIIRADTGLSNQITNSDWKLRVLAWA